MPTKAEFDEFKQKVVTVALEGAREHGWCEEVQDLLRTELGLGDLLPPTYVIQVKRSKRGGWKDYSTCEEEDFDDVQAIFKDADEMRAALLVDMPSRRSGYYLPNGYVNSTDEIDKIIEQAQRLRKQFASPVAVPTLKKNPPKWPLYRVVKRTATDEVVHEVDDAAAADQYIKDNS